MTASPTPSEALAPRPRTGVAIAALVCGLIGLLPVGITAPFAAAGLGLGVMGLCGACRRPDQCGGRRRALIGACAGLAGLLLVPTSFTRVLPALRGWAAGVQHAQDFANLRAIWRGLGLYAGRYGTYPPRMDELIQTACISWHHVASPWGENTFVRNDYNYVSGLAPGDPGHWLLTFGDPDLFGGRGAPALFMNGSVRFVPTAELRELERTTLRERAAARAAPPQVLPPGPLADSLSPQDPDRPGPTSAPSAPPASATLPSATGPGTPPN